MALLKGPELLAEIGRAQDLFGLPLRPPVIYTASTVGSIDDLGAIVLMNSGSALSYTITRASGLSRPFPVNQVLVIAQGGAGAVSVVGGTGVSINGTSAGTVTYSAIGEIACFWQYADDTWLALNKTAA